MKNVIFIATLLSCAQVSATDGPVKNQATIISKQQSTAGFDFFRGHRQGRNISLTWGMTSNAGIDQFVVECTYEDPTDPYAVWNMKGIVANDNARSFKFVDNNVYAGTMHYRIVAMGGSAPSVVSAIETIRIVSR